MVPEDNLKDAFQKVKHDIYSLYSEISSLRRNITEIHHEIAKVSDILSQLSQITQNLSKKQEKLEKENEKQGKNQVIQENKVPTHLAQNPTNQQISPTDNSQNPTTPTHLPAYLSSLTKKENNEEQLFSTGNEGVPTDRQTDQQTDNTPLKEPFPTQKRPKTFPISHQNNQIHHPIQNPIEDAVRALNSLDSLKKEIRLKFKQLTDQEILIFSTLYQIEEEQGPVDYKTLAIRLKLTESSIRDYIGRLLQKGIPIDKHKINNKRILLSVSQSLKRVASLQTILQLRDL